MTKRASYGIIETTGGFVMARRYSHIQNYEKEILELKGKGLTLKEIGERLGFTHKQIHNFITRHNANQRKIASGIVIKPKGRPRKDGTELPPSVQQLSKIAQLQYEMSRKDAKIKALETLVISRAVTGSF